MRSRDFKIGDKVLLDPTKVTQDQLEDNGSTGEFEKVYIIDYIEEGVANNNIKLRDSNWHYEEWLKHLELKNFIGGKIIWLT